MADAEHGEKLRPVKAIRIGARVVDIAGLSATDPYFSTIHDRFEPEFERLCNDFIRADYVCIDIGANIGVKTLLLAQCVPDGHVFAVEAGPTVASLLKRNVTCSDFRNVTALHSAIGDSDGTVRFTESSAYGYIASTGIEVPVRTLPSLVNECKLQRLDFVKIDVEGYEFPILQSSLELLNYHQSLVLLEFNAWTQLALAEVNPRRFAEWIFRHFSNVFRVCHGQTADYLERLPADGALQFLHTNLVHDNVVSDLLVTNFAGRLASAPGLLRRKTENLVNSQAIAPIEQDAIVAERNAAVAERDALLRSTSWRITAPLRVMSPAVRRARDLFGRSGRG